VHSEDIINPFCDPSN